MKRKAFILMALMGAAVMMVSCKKDYQKLAIEFERALPDSVEVLIEQINEVDHFVYYKNKSNSELVRYDLDKEKSESIKPELSSGESIYGVYAGNDKIVVLKHNPGMSSTFLIYDLKTMKFKEIESFWGTETNDAFVSESDKTVTGYVGLNGGPTTKYVYDFDGNKVSEEDEEEPIGDLDVPDQNPVQNWECRYCHQIIQSRDDPNLQYARCSVQNMLGDRTHSWKSLGRAY